MGSMAGTLRLIYTVNDYYACHGSQRGEKSAVCYSKCFIQVWIGKTIDFKAPYCQCHWYEDSPVCFIIESQYLRLHCRLAKLILIQREEPSRLYCIPRLAVKPRELVQFAMLCEPTSTSTNWLVAEHTRRRLISRGRQDVTWRADREAIDVSCCERPERLEDTSTMKQGST